MVNVEWPYNVLHANHNGLKRLFSYFNWVGVYPKKFKLKRIFSVVNEVYAVLHIEYNRIFFQ